MDKSTDNTSCSEPSQHDQHLEKVMQTLQSSRVEQVPASQQNSQGEEASKTSESATQGAKYLAPLVDYNPQLKKVPNSYHVVFSPEHTIEAHNTAIGTAIEPHIVFCLDFYGDKIMYIAHSIDNDLLAKIRADPGVELVQLEYRPQADSGL